MVQNTNSPPPFDHLQGPPNIICGLSFPYGSGVGAEVSIPRSWAHLENFLRGVIREEVEAKVEAHFFRVKEGKEGSGDGGGSGGTNENLRLRFRSKIPSIVYTANNIEAKNGEELGVELFDVVNDRIIDVTHPLSSASIEVVVLDGEFNDGEAITQSDFNRSIVPQRLGERLLLIGDDKSFRLENGVYSITNLSFTTNSSRSRTKKICLGLRVKHDSINNYPTVGYAVSNPFRVKDHRGQPNKKHHPPGGEDEVWRLEGIARNGEYHKRLTSHGIINVDAFVKAHQNDSRSLRKWLGNRLSDRQWKTMVKQALQYVPITIPTFDPPNLQENLELQNEAMDQNASVFNQNNIGASNGNYEFQNQTLLGNFHDFSFNHLTSEDHYNYTIQTLLSPGEASTSNAQNINNYDENTSTCNPYFQGTWNKLVLKPK
ncbi:calmodulin-binding protein 60 C isoform X2 [Cucumis sativus]|uniref:calmodulin-binding protein 60 C isoform X2 n=1 Tax=Cucumis sativus TaxID=3659 RepID=UPI0005EC6117|nr:calmodulin-binding protein 60 C isoform X2 [Cucumis sativus]KAE8653350.1 hypothetical protein Csa_007323 [Cucumis sativus]